MRSCGASYELLRLQPHDHAGWVFSGLDELVGLATCVLVDGAEHGERGLFVCDEPAPPLSPALQELVRRGDVGVATTAEVYGGSPEVDADRQRQTFLAALAEARAGGYRGIRVVADNSSLVADPLVRAAWHRWEVTADHLMAHEPVLGVCAFDRRRVDVDQLRHLATLHPLFSTDRPVPQYRLFWEEDTLRLQGDIDVLAVDHLWAVLRDLAPKTAVLVDLADSSFRSQRAAGNLLALCRQGTPVTLRGTADGVVPLRRLVDDAGALLTVTVAPAPAPAGTA